jgi:predicted outer membrane protein
MHLIMNKKNIKKYGQEILSYKLKTERQKIRAAKKGFNKKMIALDKEQTRLHKVKQNLPLVPLKEP